MTTCGECGTVWHGLTECHCAKCHSHFGGIQGFDQHRVGPDDDRRCADPATLIRRDGTPRLSGVLRGSRMVWIGNDARPHPKSRQRDAPATASGICEQVEVRKDGAVVATAEVVDDGGGLSHADLPPLTELGRHTVHPRRES